MLSDEEMWSLWNAQGSDEMNQKEAIEFARAIESAAIDAFLARTGKYLTNDASREAAIADATDPLLERIAELEPQNSIIRNEALEEAAKACEGEAVDYESTKQDEDLAYNEATKHCASAIRNLKQGQEGVKK